MKSMAAFGSLIATAAGALNSFSSPASSNVDAQTGTTYEIGIRRRGPEVAWDLSLCRTDLRNEFQCLTTSPFSPAPW